MSDMDTEAEMERRKYIEARIADARDAALNADERASKYKAERDDLRRQLDEARHTIGIYEADGPTTALKAKLEAAEKNLGATREIAKDRDAAAKEYHRCLANMTDRAVAAEARLAEEQSEAYRQRRVHGEQINEAIKMREAAESRARVLEDQLKTLSEKIAESCKKVMAYKGRDTALIADQTQLLDELGEKWEVAEQRVRELEEKLKDEESAHTMSVKNQLRWQDDAERFKKWAEGEKAKRDLAASECARLKAKYDELHDQRHEEARKADDARAACARLREALEILGAPDMWLETRDGNLEWRGAGSCADPMEIAREALQSTPTPSLRDEAKRWRECLTCELRYRDDGDNQCPKCRRKKGDGPAIIPSSSHG